MMKWRAVRFEDLTTATEVSSVILAHRDSAAETEERALRIVIYLTPKKAGRIRVLDSYMCNVDGTTT
jgi:hypothetical protein